MVQKWMKFCVIGVVLVFQVSQGAWATEGMERRQERRQHRRELRQERRENRRERRQERRENRRERRQDRRDQRQGKATESAPSQPTAPSTESETH